MNFWLLAIDALWSKYGQFFRWTPAWCSSWHHITANAKKNKLKIVRSQRKRKRKEKKDRGSSRCGGMLSAHSPQLCRKVANPLSSLWMTVTTLHDRRESITLQCRCSWNSAPFIFFLFSYFVVQLFFHSIFSRSACLQD